MGDANYLWLVGTDPVEGREAEYNDWYDNEHIEQLLRVPGVHSAARYEHVKTGGDRTGLPAYIAVYEVDDADTVIPEIRRRMKSGEIGNSDAVDPSTSVQAVFRRRG